MENLAKKTVELRYNKFKGSGKCWIAVVTKNTKEIQHFINSVSNVKRDSYSGYKVFEVDVKKGDCFLFCESGSKSSDSRRYFEVNENLELVEF